MIRTGLVSVTFRDKSPREIAALVAEEGLEGIEWGGDIHVPPGDVGNARAVRAITDDHGLKVAAYGSYYRAGNGEAFDAILEAAVELGAPIIRIWAGQRPSADADEAWWDAVVRDTAAAAGAAAKAGVKIAFEYHANTLTDGAAQASRLMERIALPEEQVAMYWQPEMGKSAEHNLASLETLAPNIANIHVYHYDAGARLFGLLEQSVDDWRRYMGAIATLPGDRYAMLEFVKDGMTEAFRQNAALLKTLVREAGQADRSERH